MLNELNNIFTKNMILIKLLQTTNVQHISNLLQRNIFYICGIHN